MQNATKSTILLSSTILFLATLTAQAQYPSTTGTYDGGYQSVGGQSSYPQSRYDTSGRYGNSSLTQPSQSSYPNDGYSPPNDRYSPNDTYSSNDRYSPNTPAEQTAVYPTGRYDTASAPGASQEAYRFGDYDWATSPGSGGPGSGVALGTPVPSRTNPAVYEAPSATSQNTNVRLAGLEAELASLRSHVSQPTPIDVESYSTGSSFEISPGFYTGFEFLFARPYIKESYQASSYSSVTTIMTLLPYSFDYGLSPRAWLGYVHESGAGIRTRYWQYDHIGAQRSLTSTATTTLGARVDLMGNPASIATNGPGQIFEVANGLEMDTIDVEGTQRLDLGRTTLVLAGGLRYITMEESFRASITDNNVVQQQLAWKRQFDGVGPIAGVEMTRPLGAGFAFVGHARGSLLFGEKGIERDVSPDGPGEPQFIRLDPLDEVVGCGEFQFGLEWSMESYFGNYLFVRGAYEGQLWTDGGGPALTFIGFDGISFAFGIRR